MALMSLGRNVALAEEIEPIDPTGKSGDQVAAESKKKLEEAQKKLLDTLTPWIPGDFVVTYGILLTAWTRLRNSFLWLILVAALSAITYVVIAAFAETGFRGRAARSDKFKKRLFVRTVSGFLVSVLAAVAIPLSGWYDFKWFTDNELPWILTAGVIAGVAVLLLKGFQKRWGIVLSNE